MAVTLTIGTSSRMYSTWAAAEAAIPADISSSGTNTPYILEAYNDSEYTSSGTILTLSGITTDSTNTITCTCAPGQSWSDNSSRQTNRVDYNVTNGVGLNASGFSSQSIYCSVDNVIFEGLQIFTTSYNMASLEVESDHIVVSNCILKSAYWDSGSPATPFRNNHSQYSTLLNSFIIANSAGGPGAWLIFGGLVANCTIVQPSPSGSGAGGTPSIKCNYGTVTVNNTAIFGFGGAFGPGTYAGSNNCTDQTFAPGTSNLLSKTFANQFVHIADDGSLDLKLKSGSDCIDAGFTDTTDIPSATDAVGTSRPQGTAWDIGAWEYLAVILAPSFRSSSHNGGATPSSLVVNKPTGTADGDLLVALIQTATGAWTAPTGWILQISDVAVPLSEFYVFTKTASAEPSSYTFTCSPTSGATDISITAYMGASYGPKVDVVGAIVDATAALSTPVTATGITNNYAGLLLGLLGSNVTGSWTTLSGWTTDFDESASAETSIQHIASTIGSTGSKTFTFPASSTVNAALMNIYLPSGYSSGSTDSSTSSDTGSGTLSSGSFTGAATDSGASSDSDTAIYGVTAASTDSNASSDTSSDTMSSTASGTDSNSSSDIGSDTMSSTASETDSNASSDASSSGVAAASTDSNASSDTDTSVYGVSSTITDTDTSSDSSSETLSSTASRTDSNTSSDTDTSIYGVVSSLTDTTSSLDSSSEATSMSSSLSDTDPSSDSSTGSTPSMPSVIETSTIVDTESSTKSSSQGIIETNSIMDSTNDSLSSVQSVQDTDSSSDLSSGSPSTFTQGLDIDSSSDNTTSVSSSSATLSEIINSNDISSETSSFNVSINELGISSDIGSYTYSVFVSTIDNSNNTDVYNGALIQGTFLVDSNTSIDSYSETIVFNMQGADVNISSDSSIINVQTYSVISENSSVIDISHDSINWNAIGYDISTSTDNNNTYIVYLSQVSEVSTSVDFYTYIYSNSTVDLLAPRNTIRFLNTFNNSNVNTTYTQSKVTGPSLISPYFNNYSQYKKMYNHEITGPSLITPFFTNTSTTKK